jgi:hypothetical protein
MSIGQSVPNESRRAPLPVSTRWVEEAEEEQTVPNHFHFIWFGSELPDFGKIAIRSALEVNRGATATLWHDGSLEMGSELRMMGHRGLQVRKISLEALLFEVQEIDPSLNVDHFARLYRCLEAPAARANLVRLLVLFLHGGIYLDTDTLCVQDLTPLRSYAAFCGTERILWPAGKSRADLQAIALAEARRICASIPRGYRLHRKFTHLYSVAANNAVLGATKHHPFLNFMLHRATAVDEGQWTRRFRMGTHLLQECLRDHGRLRGEEGARVRQLSPEHFYPVGPMISRHYFKDYDDPAEVSAELVGPDTYVIHWYASVANLKPLNYEYIRRHDSRSVYSHLCRGFAPEAEGARSGSKLLPEVSGLLPQS